MSHFVTVTSAPAPRRQQTGATLIVGLVLLLVLTVIGISGMNTATMEIAMAGNAQFQQDAFQEAEDGIDLAIGRRQYDTGDDPTTIAKLADPDLASDRWSETDFQCSTNVPRGGFSINDFDAFHFEIRANGSGPRNAPASHIQGFYVVALKNLIPKDCPAL
jgi:type IV pilus assembly protein PilX